MALISKAFRGDPKLEACLVSDPAHILEGTTGDHVVKIQMALMVLDDAKIVKTEILSKRYGTTTAAAVLAYKTKRKIINLTYQTKPDSIVGKMTMASLDKAMFEMERGFAEYTVCAGRSRSVLS